MNTELRPRGSHGTQIELLHGHIPSTVGSEYQKFSNVWESLDDILRTTGSLLRKLCAIEKRLQTSTAVEESSTFVTHASST